MTPIEIEIKLRLPNAAAHQRLSDALRPFHLRTHLQENLFFDSPSSLLSSRLAALRLRFYDGDSRCVVSLKSKPVLASGVSRVEEEEDDLDPVAARACVGDPSKLFDFDSRVLRKVESEFGRVELVCLGGFRNVRAVHGWKEGLVLELDETRYDFGTSYEIECETVEPERVKGMLEEFLKENGVEYQYSTASKFAVFRAGKLLT